ncbi:MAG: hypothetical protein KDI19_12005 [Pseudomonadales bacterium]|nr:hypothetical protein [Pseudomonadales bacterium]
MDIYHIWCDLKSGESDIAFADAVGTYLDGLVSDGRLERWRLTRRKLGLGNGAGEFHIMLEFTGLAQLDEAFTRVASRTDPVESFHHAVNSKVANVSFSLYRDFPDPVRERGSEKF